MTGVLTAPHTRFTLPAQREAVEPPEARGLRRDQVRLLVAGEPAVWHARFHDLGRFVAPGDLLVVNTSATLAAAVDGVGEDGEPVVVHFSAPLRHEPGWVVELRRPDQSGPVLDAVTGQLVRLPGATLTLLKPADTAGRLWQAAVPVPGGVSAYLADHGRPIGYRYLRGRWPLPAYQTVFARDPGSAEMPSAGRPFSTRLVSELIAAGVAVAPVTLHTGVSSLESGEPPQPERYRVPPTTARLVNLTRASGGRVVAVGTTVTRALETVAGPDGVVVAGTGWTDLVLGPDRPARVVRGLVSGFHPPDASHLLLLEAVAGPELVRRAYRAALAGPYLWHEFGDACLLLPG